MPRFAFQFDPLLRFRRYRRGLVRQLLAEILADLAAEDARRAELVSERERTIDSMMRVLGLGGSVDVAGASARRFHSSTLLADVRDVDARREIVQQQVELCRSTLVEADREVRVLERLRERRFEEFRRESERREQFALEEAWTAVRIGGTTHGTLETDR